MTEKGQKLYQERIEELKDAYGKNLDDVNALIDKFDRTNFDICRVKELFHDFRLSCEKLSDSSNNLSKFLSNYRTPEAQAELREHDAFNKSMIIKLTEFRQVIRAHLDECRKKDISDKVDSLSAVSSKSHKSLKSKVESERKKLAIMQEQVDLEKTYLDAKRILDQKLIAQKKVIENAEYELQQGAEDRSVIHDDEEELSRARLERTEAFVVDTQRRHLGPVGGTGAADPPTGDAGDRRVEGEPQTFPEDTPSPELPEDGRTLGLVNTARYKYNVLLSAFQNFNDKAYEYSNWKAKFRRLVTSLKANSDDEIELLLKFLGTKSKPHAVSISNVNSGNSKRALELIWRRLDELYGHPEVIEASIRRKLNELPKLSDADTYYKLLDVCEEILSLKVNPHYRNTLSYYDSSAGIWPLIQRLPHDEQRDWDKIVARERRADVGAYPSFSLFLDFLRDICSCRSLSQSLTVKEKPDKPEKVHKTISRKTGMDSKPEAETRAEPYVRSCIVCKENHRLIKCPKFLAYPYQKKKELISD